MLTVTENKTQLIHLMYEHIKGPSDLFTQKTLIVTGSDPVPFEISQGITSQCHDMENMQEEADTMTVQQVADVRPLKASIIADDTDIFVLLLHFCFQGDIPPSTSIQMVSPINDREVIDINATVNQHRKIIPNL